jgi:hypothetical protein
MGELRSEAEIRRLRKEGWVPFGSDIIIPAKRRDKVIESAAFKAGWWIGRRVEWFLLLFRSRQQKRLVKAVHLQRWQGPLIGPITTLPRPKPMRVTGSDG